MTHTSNHTINKRKIRFLPFELKAKIKYKKWWEEYYLGKMTYGFGANIYGKDVVKVGIN
jgi:hypothetical protein